MSHDTNFASVNAVNSALSSEDEDDAIMPSMKFLNIRQAVDHRLIELAALNEQGKFKSQRGGKDSILVKTKFHGPKIMFSLALQKI